MFNVGYQTPDPLILGPIYWQFLPLLQWSVTMMATSTWESGRGDSWVVGSSPRVNQCSITASQRSLSSSFCLRIGTISVSMQLLLIGQRVGRGCCSAPDYRSAGRVINPAPLAWFIPKFIWSLAQFAPGSVWHHGAESLPTIPFISFLLIEAQQVSRQSNLACTWSVCHLKVHLISPGCS